MDFGVLTAIIIGGVMGECIRHLSFSLIKNRNGQSASVLLNSRLGSFLWILVGALGSFIISIFIKDLITRIEYIMIFFVLLSLSAVDLSIRKIPNELIAALLIIKIVSIVVIGDYESILPALAGLLAGFVIFLVPSLLKIEIGWGDVKLAAASGFCLGIMGVFQAVLIMAAVMAIYFIYLLISKKGTLKTKVAIGPSFSIGMMLTLIFPLSMVIK
ncbi:MAG: prepilin peptidase [Eubacteriales bacterium]